MLGLRFFALAFTPLLLAYFVWGLQIETGRIEDAAPPGSTRPDAIVEKPDITLYDLNGRVVQRFEGERFENVVGDRWLEITKPVFDLSSADGEYWNLTAVRGLYDQESANFHLMGDVIMQRTTGFVPLRMSSQALSINTANSIARSDAGVVIESPGHRITGDGFFADLQTGQVELRGSVEAFHEAL